MRFHWPWLSRVLHVPYVPTLGPVHPDNICAELFDAVIGVSGTGRFLPQDKDRRWFTTKDEYVLVADVIHESDRTVIPTLSRRGAGTVKVHHYGIAAPGVDDLADLAGRLREEHGVATARIVWGQSEIPNRRVSATNLLLKDFRNHRPVDFRCVLELSDCSSVIRRTLPELARDPDNAGFGFLHERYEAGALGGPVLVLVSDDRITGAIGPMEVASDERGIPVLLPQYFGVRSGCRGRGYGRDLWRAAMSWGAERGAAYQLLQTEADGVSETLCLKEGLVSLGYVCVSPVPSS